MSKEKEINEQDKKKIVATKDAEITKTKSKVKKEAKKISTKKLPRLFKKRYTDKKLNKKLYSKVYVPEDKKYLQSLFVECGTKGKKNIPLYAVPKDLTFTKKEIKRLKTLKKELKKQ